MRLCAAGESTSNQNKRALIQGAAKFLPLEQDCRQVQRVAQNLLDFCKKGGEARNVDRTPMLNLINHGLFNTGIQQGIQASGSRLNAPPSPVHQGISVFITSMPTNLHSGIQPQHLDKDMQFEGDIRHLLTDSHPHHINEPTWWGISLRELLWQPPLYKPWVGSYAFESTPAPDVNSHQLRSDYYT